jgi:hypothetical protein
MRMNPLHLRRKFWWELLFVSTLLFLLVGVRWQKKAEVVALVIPPALLPPVAEWSALAGPRPLSLD